MSHHEALRRLSSSSFAKSSKTHDSVVGSDMRAFSSDGNSVLSRFGHEVPSHMVPSSVPISQEIMLHQENVKNFEEESIFSQITALSKIRPKTLKVVSGSQFRLTTKTWSQCEQCDFLDRANKKNKEAIRSLKLQLARLEERFKDLKYSRSLEQSLMEAKSSTDSDQKGADNGAPSKKVERLEDEVLKLKKMVGFERSTSEALRQSLEDVQASLNNTIASLRSELEKSYMLNSGVELENKELNAEIMRLQTELQQVSSQLDQSKKLSFSRQNSEEFFTVEVQRLKKEIERMDGLSKNQQATIQQKQALISQQEVKVVALLGSISSLEEVNKSLQNEISNLNATIRNGQDQIAVFRKRCEVLENSVKVANQERDAIKTTILEREIVINEKNRKIESLELELRNHTSKMNDLLKRIASESETTKKALEKSIASSVRLCVVAPTVNVHVNEGKTKYKSKLSEYALKSFLQNEVFEKYCFLFKQSSEGSSPIYGENLEVWLQKMLSQMQMSIESHVNSAMEGSSM